MARQFLVNTETKREYEVMGKNPETGDLILKGMETGVEFPQPFNKAQLKSLGYVVKRVEDAEEDEGEDE